MLNQRHIRKTAWLLATLALMLGFQNCADQKFAGGAEGGSNGGGPGGVNTGAGTDDPDATGIITVTGGQNCRDELQTLNLPFKFLFVVDNSGSNAPSGNDPGTDPNRVVRAGSIQRFYNTYNGKTNFNWGFIHFAGSTATPLITSGGQSAFTASASLMQTAISLFNATTDFGATPYAAALNLAGSTISNDTAGRTQQTKYMVVFMSDGLPNPDITLPNLRTMVQSLVNRVPGQISFNSIYYGPTNAAATERMSEMAKAGGGNFLDTNTNPSGNQFLITDIVQIPGVICQ